MISILRKETAITALFLLAIMLPVSGMLLLSDNSNRLLETSEHDQPPRLSFTDGSLGKFPYEYSKYFNEHFGFRNVLVRMNYIVRHDLLGSSPMKEVLFGKDGWLFCNVDGAIEDYRGITDYNDKTLEHWAKTLEMKRAWLENQGIRYLFVVAPNKSSIYGEYLPEPYHRIREKTGLDDLLNYLKTHTNVEVVDVRPALLAAKSWGRIYHKTDTHWNEYGAFLVYREIMKPVTRWFPSLIIQSFDDYLIEKKVATGGDLAKMFGGTEFITEERINFKPLDGHSIKIEDINSVKVKSVTVTHTGSYLLRAVVFRDSFFGSVAPFFAEHFSYSRYYWQYWDSQTPIEEILSITRPDIVIEEIVERFVKTKMADFVASPPVMNAAHGQQNKDF